MAGASNRGDDTNFGRGASLRTVPPLRTAQRQNGTMVFRAIFSSPGPVTAIAHCYLQGQRSAMSRRFGRRPVQRRGHGRLWRLFSNVSFRAH